MPAITTGHNPNHYLMGQEDGARVWHEVVGVDWGAGFAPYRTARTILGDTAVAPIP